jgi:glycosyltransferase involved in cell wall biosynthesis
VRPIGRKRFLFVLEYFHPHVGGVETLFGHLVERLAALGHDVTVITSRIAGTPARERWHGVEIVRVRTPRLLARYVFMIAALPAAIVHARRADIVHTTTYNAAPPAWIAAMLARKPSVITVHEVFASQWMRLPGMSRLAGLAHWLFEWLVLHLPFDRFVCDSEHTRRRLADSMHVPDDRTAVVYPAVDYDFWQRERFTPLPLKRELGLDDDAFLYLYFGRPGVSKGIEFLIEAAATVRARAPNSRLLLILADDPFSQFHRLLREIERRGLEDHVIVHPSVPREELPAHLLAADCVVIPSISEGFGYSAIEAALLGRRIVATSGHSVEEILPRNATFVPPRNAAALADAILASRSAPAPAPPERQYTLQRHIDGMLEIYASLCAS